jgi:putative glutamine amidotransferase
VRPRIAITSWKRHLPTFLGERTDLYTLGAEYVDCVARPGALPLLLPHLAPDDADAALDGVDALVVAGGGDVDPASYGATNTGSYDHDPVADASELALLRAARERGLATLAICRGMQLVNVAFGGTLHQDIGVPGGVHEPISHLPQEVLDATHPIEVVAGSRLAAVVGAGERVVNTIHHQAIDRLADGFQVTATAPDGMIEAIEPDDDAWAVLAVQWHPEKANGQDAALFAWLADAARAHASLTSRSGTAPAGRR